MARSIDLNSDAVRGFTAAAAFLAGVLRLGLAGAAPAAAAGAPASASEVTSPVSGSMDSPGPSVSAGGSSSVTYGPNRPSLATISLPLSGFTPMTRSVTTGASTSSRALAGVSSSGARSGGMFTRRGVASGSAVGLATSR